HVALVTGLKHYLWPFEAYAKVQPDTPFSEDQPRLPYENFYYVQEDVLFAAAERDGFTWSVHRPHTLIGWALGNAMNMGVTLAAYAAICRETGPFNGEPAPLERQMADAEEIWPEIVRRHGLRDLKIEKLASWWHTDADLGRTVETFTDMGRSRRLGFLGVRDSESSFTDLFS